MNPTLLSFLRQKEKEGEKLSNENVRIVFRILVTEKGLLVHLYINK